MTMCEHFVSTAFVVGCNFTQVQMQRQVARCQRLLPAARSCQHAPRVMAMSNPADDSTEAMRSRLEGLFGGTSDDNRAHEARTFNGTELRRVMKERFTVQYDIQPVVRLGQVYLHIMWRYYEQVSFYMDEDQWSEHMEAVADLLKKWDAVDYFCAYIRSVKKRPVVGISLHVKIPNITRDSPLFPTSSAFD